MKHSYLRVSTNRQNLQRQIDGLTELSDRLWIEKGVSATAHRPVFEELMVTLKKGDTLIVWDLDRAFRSTIDALTIGEELQERGVHFDVVSMPIDTSTIYGQYAYTIWAAGCEMERKLIRKRTREGMAAAKARGKRLGRRPALTPVQVGQIKRKLQQQPELPITQLARQYGVSHMTIRRAVKRENC